MNCPPTAGTDLHEVFAAPDRAQLEDRAQFLRTADQVPGFVAMRLEMRRYITPPDHGTLVDAGCGMGWETERLAAAHPAATVIGVDHDHEALRAARARTAPSNVHWHEGDVTALDLAAGSVDVLRTERTLIYVDDLSAAIASITSVLRRGGVFAGFELDYGASALPPLGRSTAWIQDLSAGLESALPQPWAGRRLPEMCLAHGLEILRVEPLSFTVDRPVWSRIVAGTLRTASREGRLDLAGVEEWIVDLLRPDAPFRGSFTGILTVAVRP